MRRGRAHRLAQRRHTELRKLCFLKDFKFFFCRKGSKSLTFSIGFERSDFFFFCFRSHEDLGTGVAVREDPPATWGQRGGVKAH